MSDQKNQPPDIFIAIKNNSLISNRLKIIVEILQIYNPRISEILNLTWSNVYPHQFIILNGLKKSSNVIIRDRLILNKVMNLKPNGSDFVFYPIKYYTVYHFIKSNFSHLFNSLTTAKNKKITHAYRYLNVRPLANVNQITDVLYHKSIRSAIFYKKSLKEVK